MRPPPTTSSEQPTYLAESGEGVIKTPMQPLTIPIRGNKLAMQVAIQASVLSRKTEFQQIDIVDTEVFGRMLLLDGHVQFATMDEHAYHEALVHIPMLSLSEPKRALVVGGGDGGVVRELTRHTSLETIDMVEIDQGVIDSCREFLPSLSGGAFEDPRVRVYVKDAFEFVRNTQTPYDLIVMDSTDVYEGESGELSERLFSMDFYRDCHRALSGGGFVVTQADNLVFCPYSLEAIRGDFEKVFSAVGSYQALVPSFGGYSGFCWGSKGVKVSKDFPAEHAARLPLRYINETTYRLAMEELSFS